jgi:hypothetical protein
MLFAHWMYFLAALLSLCASTGGDDKDDDHSNVHARGVELMSAPEPPKKSSRRRSKTGRSATAALLSYRNRNNTTIDLAHNYLATRQREPPGLHNEEEIVFFRDDDDANNDDVASGISNSTHGAYNNLSDVRASRLLPFLVKHIHGGRVEENSGNAKDGRDSSDHDFKLVGVVTTKQDATGERQTSSTTSSSEPTAFSVTFQDDGPSQASPMSMDPTGQMGSNV